MCNVVNVFIFLKKNFLIKIVFYFYILGELVICAGFPFFSSTLPTITRGNVSNVSACMLQTTCCVQSGASGGPIVRFDTGELLGMVVCNVISSNTLYPRLNMAIPAAVFKDPINEYIKTGGMYGKKIERIFTYLIIIIITTVTIAVIKYFISKKF